VRENYPYRYIIGAQREGGVTPGGKSGGLNKESSVGGVVIDAHIKASQIHRVNGDG